MLAEQRKCLLRRVESRTPYLLVVLSDVVLVVPIFVNNLPIYFELSRMFCSPVFMYGLLDLIIA